MFSPDLGAGTAGGGSETWEVCLLTQYVGQVEIKLDMHTQGKPYSVNHENALHGGGMSECGKEQQYRICWPQGSWRSQRIRTQEVDSIDARSTEQSINAGAGQRKHTAQQPDKAGTYHEQGLGFTPSPQNKQDAQLN